MWSSLSVAWLCGLLTPPVSRSSLASGGGGGGSGGGGGEGEEDDAPKDWVVTVALGDDVSFCSRAAASLLPPPRGAERPVGRGGAASLACI